MVFAKPQEPPVQERAGLAKRMSISDENTGRDQLTEPLHVLHMAQAINTGLAHRIADDIAAHIADGVSVTLLTPPSLLAGLASAAGARLVRWDGAVGAPATVPMRARRARELITARAPHVVHLHGSRAGLVGRTAVRGRIPTVFSPYAWSFLSPKGFRQRQVREWERMAARWTTVTLCASQAEVSTGRRAGLRGRFEVIPHQINLAPIQRLSHLDRASVRSALGVSAGQPLVVCAARLCEQKGQDVAMTAWPLVREAIPNAQLVLLGEGPARGGLTRRAVPGVVFAGQKERDVALQWMYAADVVISPSRWEGSSLVVAEAMALGRPVVVSDVDGMRELVAAETGRFVPPNYPRALGAAITELLADPASAMEAGFQARKLAGARQEQLDTPGQLRDMYRCLADTRGRSPESATGARAPRSASYSA